LTFGSQCKHTERRIGDRVVHQLARIVVVCGVTRFADPARASLGEPSSAFEQAVVALSRERVDPLIRRNKRWWGRIFVGPLIWVHRRGYRHELAPVA